MSTRLLAGYTKIGELIHGRQSAIDGSVGDRTKLLLLSYRLFREAPLLGVGARGWSEGIARLAEAPDPKHRIGTPYNQAHNQYADDLAKGGIVRFLLGFLVLFLPLFLFFRCEPYSEREGSEFALAGVVISAGFMIFCLTESLMILNVTNTVQTSLVFYLLGGCDAVRRNTAAVSSSERSRGNIRGAAAARRAA